MHWWAHAGELAQKGKLRRFGLITTNSLRQTFNRRVLEPLLSAKPPLSIVYAIPDHPWVDSADGAAVRIAMTVSEGGAKNGVLALVSEEDDSGDDARVVALTERRGIVNADLTIGANVGSALSLKANSLISSPGVKLHGAGFIVTPEEATGLGLGTVRGLEEHIRLYRNGKDLTDIPRGVMVIDLFGLTDDDVRRRFPAVYQWLLERVKPERDAKAHTKDGAGYARLWWLHGKPRSELRPALRGLKHFIGTVETAKHRFFQFLPMNILPDNMLIAIGSEDALVLGVLSSRLHVAWALALGGRLGVGNDARYNKTRCFETFPFPKAMEGHKDRIRSVAEQIDVHRKRQQALHSNLTMTGMYNVLEKLRSGAALSEKEKATNEQGLVSVLRDMHDDLDRAVFEAYGWTDLAGKLLGRPGATTPLIDKLAEQTEAEKELLSRLVALNAERVAEEKKGTIRWLRPEFQVKVTAPASIQAELDVTEEDDSLVATATVGRIPWPKDLPDQVRAVVEVLAIERRVLDANAIAGCFSGKGPWKKGLQKRLPQLLETLESVGRARKVKGGWIAAA
jgi:hypothetical protein